VFSVPNDTDVRHISDKPATLHRRVKGVNTNWLVTLTTKSPGAKRVLPGGVWDHRLGGGMSSVIHRKTGMDNSCECLCDCEGIWQYTTELELPDSGRIRRLFLCLACARHTSMLAERFRLPVRILRRRELAPPKQRQGVQERRSLFNEQSADQFAEAPAAPPVGRRSRDHDVSDPRATSHGG
jgi:hypothetical protein